MIGDRQRDLDVLLDEQHRTPALFPVCGHHGQQSFHDDWRQAEGHLVEHEQLRFSGQRAPKGKHLLLTPRQQPGASIGELCQSREVLVRDVCVEPLAGETEPEVFGDSEPEEDASPLGYVSDTQLGSGRR